LTVGDIVWMRMLEGIVWCSGARVLAQVVALWAGEEGVVREQAVVVWEACAHFFRGGDEAVVEVGVVETGMGHCLVCAGYDVKLGDRLDRGAIADKRHSMAARGEDGTCRGVSWSEMGRVWMWA
jgi:hypothetical protein